MVHSSTTDQTIQFVAPKTTINKFMDTLLDKKILFQVIKMDGTVLIYINALDQPCCNSLDMAMMTRYSSNPNTTSLLGSTAEHPGTNVASRIAKKLNKPVYLSLNLEDTRLLMPLAEKRLIQEINQYPDKF